MLNVYSEIRSINLIMVGIDVTLTYDGAAAEIYRFY